MVKTAALRASFPAALESFLQLLFDNPQFEEQAHQERGDTGPSSSPAPLLLLLSPPAQPCTTASCSLLSLPLLLSSLLPWRTLLHERSSCL